MSNQTLEIQFSQKKCDVLKFFLQDKGTTIEEEMKNTLDNLYEKFVPKQTKGYIDFQIQQEEEQENAVAVDENAAVSTTRGRGRPRNSRTQTQDSTPVETPDEAITQSEGDMVLG